MNTALCAVVVDEWALFRQGVAWALASAGVEVAAQVAGTEQAMLALWSAPADLVVAGNPAHGHLGDLVRAIKEAHPRTRVLALLPAGPAEALRSLLATGVEGVLARSAGPEELADAVRRLAAGERVLAPAVVLPGFVTMKVAPVADHDLTSRELATLALLAEGLSNREIAARLVISEATVKTHLSRLYAKLAASGRSEAVRRGVELGILA